MTDLTKEDLQDQIDEAICDSLDAGWTSADGARAIMRIPIVSEAAAMFQALRSITKAMNGRVHSRDAIASLAEADAILARIDRKD